MNLSEKDIELTPGKLYTCICDTISYKCYSSGYYARDTLLNPGSVLFYTGVIKNWLNVHYYEFLYMGKLIYIILPINKRNFLTKLV
jgi:hypothetical protein